MKDKKGFTIVELCVSIVLLLLLAVLVMPRLLNLGDSSKEKLYNSKVNLALSSAYKYGKDNIDKLNNNCTEVTIGMLINLDYLDGDDETGFNMINPVNGNSMNGVIICIRYVNGDILTELKS